MAILWALADAKVDEREVVEAMLEREPHLLADRPGLLLITDKGFASKRFEQDLAERGSGLSESEWMARSYPYVDRLVKSGEYPIFTEIVMEARQPHLSRDDQFRYGLQRVLDCIAAALPSTAEPPMSAHREEREGQDGPGQDRS